MLTFRIQGEFFIVKLEYAGGECLGFSEKNFEEAFDDLWRQKCKDKEPKNLSEAMAILCKNFS